jgi:hypothetical protein
MPKIYTSQCPKKCKYTQKIIEVIFNLLNIVIPCDGDKFVSHVKSLIIIKSQMGVFGGNDHICMCSINILTNYHFQMEDDKICQVGHLKKIHFKHFLD